MDPQVKSYITKLIEETKQSIFNELYVDYYNKYGQDVGRGLIKYKLKGLITSDDVKEAISSVIDGTEISAEPSTCIEIERVKAFFEIIQGFLLLEWWVIKNSFIVIYGLRVAQA
ncbi:MAG: hypothetical protein PV340_04385 [Wolbachia sp.]|nr:hypothetical protein [Wolbachia sp.]MDD9336621.1 hypothetical protein [Wolbachia sp.]